MPHDPCERKARCALRRGRQPGPAAKAAHGPGGRLPGGNGNMNQSGF